MNLFLYHSISGGIWGSFRNTAPMLGQQLDVSTCAMGEGNAEKERRKE